MLEGERIRLRALAPEDTETVWRYWSDLDVSARASNQPTRPWSLEWTKNFFQELDKKDDMMRFAIEADGEVIGDCSLHDIDRFNRCCEVGISIGKPYWSKGYGQEALTLLVGFAFHHQNMHRVGLEALADDPRAVGCYRKVGFVEEGTMRKRDWAFGEYRDVMIMSILDEEWSARPPA